jgi:hypothetical protein
MKIDVKILNKMQVKFNNTLERSYTTINLDSFQNASINQHMQVN